MLRALRTLSCLVLCLFSKSTLAEKPVVVDTDFARLINECDVGRDAESCHWVGGLHNGLIPSVDVSPSVKARLSPKLGTKYLAKACALGFAESCRLSHRNYLNGIGVAADGMQAYDFLLRGCNLGHKASCADATEISINVSVMMCDENGSIADCTGAGMYYEQRNRDSNDLVLARKYYAKACKMGHITGCCYFGEADKCLLAGNGLLEMYLESNDANALRQARQVFNKACNLGQQAGCQAIKGLKSE